jgi:Pvc16 N-terminal domain
MRNEHTLNTRPTRTSSNQLVGPPIPINLYYLITPMQEDPEIQQTVLGKVLQVFNDHAILRGSDLQASLQGSTEELRLMLETLTLEELTQVWYSLQEPYQLSVSYLVQVVTIESALEPVLAPPVLARNSSYDQILGSEGGGR